MMNWRSRPLALFLPIAFLLLLQPEGAWARGRAHNLVPERKVIPVPLLRVLELVAFALVVVAAVTQLVIPLWRGTPLGPIFRRERKLEGELERARQARLEADLQARIARERGEGQEK